MSHNPFKSVEPSASALEFVKHHWSLNGELEFIRKVENWIYKNSDSHTFIRMTELSHRKQAQVEAELDWMFYLGDKGIQVAYPYKSINDNLLEIYSDAETTYFISAFKEASGHPLKDIEDFTENRVFNWGELIGELHQKTLSYNADHLKEKRPLWSEERSYQSIKKLCRKDLDLLKNFILLDKWLKTLPINDQVFNLIHADIHHGNFFINSEDQLTVFDFDDCQYHWFIYDIAVAIYTFEFSMREYSETKEFKSFRNSIIKGYLKSTPLEKKWLDCIDGFILFRHFAIYAFTQSLLNESTDKSEETIQWCIEAEKISLKAIYNFDYDSLPQI